MKYINELDHPVYRVVDVRGFFDKELPLTDDQIAVLTEQQEKFLAAQLFLRTVYMGGDRPKIEVPAWLEKAVNERKQSKPDSVQASSKKSQQTLTLKGSSTNTNP